MNYEAHWCSVDTGSNAPHWMVYINTKTHHVVCVDVLPRRRMAVRAANEINRGKLGKWKDKITQALLRVEVV